MLKTKKKNLFFSEYKSNQVLIVSCYKKEYKHLTNKIIRSVFYRDKPVNQILKMLNKWNSSVKEGTFTQIS